MLEGRVDIIKKIVWFISCILLLFYGIYKHNLNSSKAKDQNLRIAILDSGIKKELHNHSFSVVKEYNALNPGDPVIDNYGHGTAVAGIITSIPKSKNKRVDIYDVKVLDDSGSGEIKDLIAGIKWAINESVDIINISLGLHEDNELLAKVIQEALEKDIIVVASAGNNYGLYVDYPAKYEGVISVSAIKDNKEKLFSDESGKIDIVDYGINIESVDLSGNKSEFSGSSFATANATKKILLLILNGELPRDNSYILENLKKHTLDLGKEGYDEKFGIGLLE